MRTDTLEAKERNARGQVKEQGHKRKCSQKKSLHKKFSGDLQKNGLEKIFSADLQNFSH